MVSARGCAPVSRQKHKGDLYEQRRSQSLEGLTPDDLEDYEVGENLRNSADYGRVLVRRYLAMDGELWLFGGGIRLGPENPESQDWNQRKASVLRELQEWVRGEGQRVKFLYCENTEGGAEIRVLEAAEVIGLLRWHPHRVEGEADQFCDWCETALIGAVWWFSKGIVACVREDVNVRYTTPVP